MMRPIIYAAVLGLTLATAAPASATEVTCALINWAIANLPQSMLDNYKTNATPEQTAIAKACFADGKIHKGGTHHAHTRHTRRHR